MSVKLILQVIGLVIESRGRSPAAIVALMLLDLTALRRRRRERRGDVTKLAVQASSERVPEVTRLLGCKASVKPKGSQQ